MPFNFLARHKWMWVGLLSSITLLTPFSSSILSPAIDTLEREFGNTNAIVGSMTVSIYLLGYVVGPVLIAPLSEKYGRKPVLSAGNAFFCLWQIGCALAPNIEALIICRFFSGVGGAACLVSVLCLILLKRLTDSNEDFRGEYYRRSLSSRQTWFCYRHVEHWALDWLVHIISNFHATLEELNTKTRIANH